MPACILACNRNNDEIVLSATVCDKAHDILTLRTNGRPERMHRQPTAGQTLLTSAINIMAAHHGGGHGAGAGTFQRFNELPSAHHGLGRHATKLTMSSCRRPAVSLGQ